MDVFPQASVAVQIIVFEPRGYGPEGLNVIVTVEPTSNPVAVPIEALDVHKPASTEIVAVGGHVITGGTVSIIVNVA